MHLDAVLVVPFNNAANFLAVFEENDHRSSAVHLTDKIIIFSIRLLRRRGLLPFRLGILLLNFRQIWPN